MASGYVARLPDEVGGGFEVVINGQQIWASHDLSQAEDMLNKELARLNAPAGGGGGGGLPMSGGGGSTLASALQGLNFDPALELKKWMEGHALDVAKFEYAKTSGDRDAAYRAYSGTLSLFDQLAGQMGFFPNLNLSAAYAGLGGQGGADFGFLNALQGQPTLEGRQFLLESRANPDILGSIRAEAGLPYAGAGQAIAGMPGSAGMAPFMGAGAAGAATTGGGTAAGATTSGTTASATGGFAGITERGFGGGFTQQMIDQARQWLGDTSNEQWYDRAKLTDNMVLREIEYNTHPFMEGLKQQAATATSQGPATTPPTMDAPAMGTTPPTGGQIGVLPGETGTPRGTVTGAPLGGTFESGAGTGSATSGAAAAGQGFLPGPGYDASMGSNPRFQQLVSSPFIQALQGFYRQGGNMQQGLGTDTALALPSTNAIPLNWLNSQSPDVQRATKGLYPGLTNDAFMSPFMKAMRAFA